MKRVDVAYVLLYDHDKENILTVKNQGENSSYYTLPGGAVENGETLEDAAIREVKEETGLTVELEGIFAISEAFFEKQGHHAIFFTFKGRILSGEIKISCPEEIEEITWMNEKTAEKYAYIPTEVEGLVKSKTIVPYILHGKAIHRI
ncbi:NUDIX hydrolase [Planococcus antarcticus DSM 14505]|uniref:NUDIX hydrolase n=1 Tax=Planococcus antarcticus DSM 14505 TaxID=1185653 RepID=A0AA87LQI8_9BACL|nr:NUDIX hydrolase [Planococcus antarcticus]EIM06298.1 NUDIX hydrolase [Planococcus antarcticus DSM 14505]